MNISEVKQEYQLQQWRGMVQERLESGLTILNIPPQWCGETAPRGAQPPLKWCIHSA